MSTYAIIETGGKQYRVEEGQSLLVDRLSAEEGEKIALRAVMLRTDDDVVLTAPDLEKVKVEAKVAGHERGEKIKVFKYKAKKGYRRHQGHRSELTRLEVVELKQLTRKPAKKAAENGVGGKAEAAPKKSAPKKEPAKEPAAKKEEAKGAAEAADAGGLPETVGKPATRALTDAGLTTLEQVAGKTEEELLALHGIGPKAVEALAEALEAEGLSLKQTDEEKS
jgi:large subunit ribosomal protein L21